MPLVHQALVKAALQDAEGHSSVGTFNCPCIVKATLTVWKSSLGKGTQILASGSEMTREFMFMTRKGRPTVMWAER